MKVLSIEPTPNPNAFKFNVDRPLLASGSRDYKSAEDARGDALASGLFAIPGITNVFVMSSFVTVTLAADADWRAANDGVRTLLESHEPEPIAASGGATASVTSLSAEDAAVLERVNALLDERVRPALAGDGGGLQIVGLQDKILSIRYEGACGTCPSSITGTLRAIENLLRSEVDEELQVVPG